MNRSENCVNAKIVYIYFEDDSLAFEFAKSKGHKYGEENLGRWHIYAIPKKLCIQTVLALVIYLMTYKETLAGKWTLF